MNYILIIFIYLIAIASSIWNSCVWTIKKICIFFDLYIFFLHWLFLFSLFIWSKRSIFWNVYCVLHLIVGLVLYCLYLVFLYLFISSIFWYFFYFQYLTFLLCWMSFVFLYLVQRRPEMTLVRTWQVFCFLHLIGRCRGFSSNLEL